MADDASAFIQIYQSRHGMIVRTATGVPRQFVYGHFVYDTSSTDISSTDISSNTVYQRTGQLYIQLLFRKIIILINSNFYFHYDSLLSIPLLVRKNSLHESSFYWHSFRFITPDSISARKVIVDEMSVDEMSVDEVS